MIYKEARDLSFIPPEYRKDTFELSDEEYRELLFIWGSHMRKLCGNSKAGGNFWMNNQNDNCIKILEKLDNVK